MPVTILFSALTAFLVTIFGIFLIKPLALRLNLVDVPGGRKHHHGEIPLVGGIAMFLGLMFALLTLSISLSDYRSFIAAYALLVFVGVLDDFHELSPKARLVAQIIAALLMTCWGGIALHNLGDLLGNGNIVLHNWAIPFTLFTVVGMINAVNMTDGIDGLAGTLSLIELIALWILAYHAQLLPDVFLLSLLVSCVLGFLVFNWRLPGRSHALVFMGDAGSMPLGFVLVWFLVSLTQGQHPAANPVTMLWIMTIPIFDMTSVMVQRVISHRSPFAPDRKHLHHLLLKQGMSVPLTTITLSSLAILFAAIGLMGEFYQINQAIMFLGFISCFGLYCLGLFLLWKKLEY